MRYRSFDGTRVIATLFVTLYHALVIFNMDSNSWRPMVGFFFQTFFFGSGFFIARIILNYLNLTNKVALKTFYMRRILRTWPLYFLGLVIYLLFESAGNELWKYFVFIQNFWNTPFYIHSWSVAIEEQFYIFCPLLVVIMVKYFNPTKVFLTAVALVIYLRYHFEIYFFNNSANNTLLWIDGLLLGVYFAMPSSSRWIEILKKNYFWIQMTFPILFWLLIKNYRMFGPFYNTLWAIVVISYFTSSLNEKSLLGKFLSLHIFRILTARTYSIYLFHTLPMYGLSRFNYDGPGFTIQKLGLVLCSMILMLILAEIIYRYIEKPILDYRDRRFPEIRAHNSA